MSVIAKMNVVGMPRGFGDSGYLIELSCVCENDLMAQYHPENEDVVFSKASPSGDARLHAKADFYSGDQIYLIFTKGKECPEFEGAALVIPAARCVSVTDFGGTSKQVEVCSRYGDGRGLHSLEKLVLGFSLRMMIDNPPAAAYFAAGSSGYHIAIYRCRDMTMEQALALAHGFSGAAAKPVEEEVVS